jgi:undecaprenyl-diphosphatase
MSTAEARLGWYIAVGTIPALVAGLVLGDLLDRIFGEPRIAAAMLLGTALILVMGERGIRGTTSLARMTWADGLLIGLAQALALFPGISRSGVTIAAGMSRGLERASAARFSFLLGVPAIAGAGLLSLAELIREGGLADRALDLGLAFAASALVGYMCIHFLLTWLRKRSLYPFATYCAVVGTLFLLSTLL